MAEERTVWTVKGGRRGEREERLLEHGLIGGGWELLPSLAEIGDKENLAALYRAAYPEAKTSAAANYVGQLWSLVYRMQKSDLVVLPCKTTGTIAVGRIDGPYEFREDLGEDLRHCRPVHWTATDVARDAFDQDLLYSFGAFLTFGRVKRDNAEARILSSVEGRSTVPPLTIVGGTEDESVDDAPDIELLAQEQVRQYVTQSFAGHDLADLVAHVLGARGYSCSVSPPGADRGVDILAGSGPLGLDRPRLAVQVKTGQAGVDEFRSLRGVMANFQADQGLLVAWAGFKGTVRAEARLSHFTIRLWDADDLLAEIFGSYEKLPELIRSQLPIKRVWALVPESE